MKKITIIGAGNLGLSIANGLIEEQLVAPDSITLTKRNVSSLADLKSSGMHVMTENSQAIEGADFIFLCVQPNQLAQVASEIRGSITKNQTLISVITGVSILDIQALLGDELLIIRAMPNIAASIGESMTCLATSDRTNERLNQVEELFEAIGQTLLIEEELMQAATVLGASGIAFFMRYLRAATQGGVQMGFHSADAQKIAVQTAKGAASLILENQNHPEAEIDKVTTPQGCTIEGLNEMEHRGFSSALIRGIMTSFERITKMKKNNNEPV